MDITTNTTAINTNTTTNNSSAAAATIKRPEDETETPTRIQPAKPVSFSNGVLKRHQPLHHHHHHHHHHGGFNNHHAVVVTYRECLKNHAASLGGHAVDGCGEFMPSPTSNPSDPTSLKCAACGCHRNFHRREPEDPLAPSNATAALEYQPHHRHHPPPPPHRNSTGHSSPSSASPPPISSAYYPSAPHMLLALSSGLSGPPTDNTTPIYAAGNTGSSRKRYRTKFTQYQKDKMLEFAERVGWKMQKRDEELISGFCNEVGVNQGVLKVWMHNNKNTLGKKDQNSNTIPSTTTTTAPKISSGIGIGFNVAAVGATSSSHYHHHHDDDNNNCNSNSSNNNDDGQELGHHHVAHVVVNTNGSSSSS